MNTLPFHYDQPLDELPSRGWDWMLTKGISDYEEQRTANYLGGLQVIVRREYQRKGNSKKIISHLKNYIKDSDFANLVIPIRPTQKHRYPHMSMSAYLDLKEGGSIYDPWIRTHIKGGAQIIKVCEESMLVTGDLNFWQHLLKREDLESGQYVLEGALSPVTIDVASDSGEYREPNIWVRY